MYRGSSCSGSRRRALTRRFLSVPSAGVFTCSLWTRIWERRYRRFLLNRTLYLPAPSPYGGWSPKNYYPIMNFNRANNIVGWIVGLITCTVFVMNMEPTGSFWDCGEFISSCYKLQIPHPPGAPLFVLMGRFFIILFGDNPHTAARGVNFMSALLSGLTILFLFWIITHFARKIVLRATPNGEPDRLQT